MYASSYVGARYYRPDLGRFTTVDPGHVNGDIGDSQSWSPYASVRNNPLRYADPSGTAYWIQVPAGLSFPVDFESLDELRAYVDGFSIEGGIFSGIIKNRAGVEVATYTYFRSEKGTPSGHCDPFCQMVLGAGNRADAGLQAGAVFMAGAAAVGATGGLAAGVLSGGVAVSPPFLLPMGGRMAAAMGAVQNPALRRALDDIYRWQDSIAGGLAGAVRYTQQTGRLVGGSDHLGKLTNSIGRLENILRNQTLSPTERQLTQSVLNELKGLRR